MRRLALLMPLLSLLLLHWVAPSGTSLCRPCALSLQCLEGCLRARGASAAVAAIAARVWDRDTHPWPPQVVFCNAGYVLTGFFETV